MKYIRTKDDIYEIEPNIVMQSQSGKLYQTVKGLGILEVDVIKQADTIEELCDCLVIRNRTNNRKLIYSKNEFRKRVKRNKTKIGGKDNYEDRLKYLLEYNDVFGAIWTDKGLIYVAKMNDKGELELL